MMKLMFFVLRKYLATKVNVMDDEIKSESILKVFFATTFESITIVVITMLFRVSQIEIRYVSNYDNGRQLEIRKITEKLFTRIY